MENDFRFKNYTKNLELNQHLLYFHILYFNYILHSHFISQLLFALKEVYCCNDSLCVIILAN